MSAIMNEKRKKKKEWKNGVTRDEKNTTSAKRVILFFDRCDYCDIMILLQSITFDIFDAS